MLKIAYIYPEKLPAKNARSISVINTFINLSKICNVQLYIEKSDFVDIQRFYNLENANNIVNINKKCIIRTNKIFNFNLLKRLKKDDINIVYVRHLKVASYLIGNGFAVIFECHEVFHQTTANKNSVEKLKALEHFVYTKSVGLTFINKSLQNEFNKIFKLKNFQQIVHNGADCNSSFHAKKFDNNQEIYYVGNFIKWKGLEDLIVAISKIDNLQLNIVGDGSEKQNLINLINKLNIQNRVKFLGFKSKKQIYEILTSRSRFTVIPNQKTRYSNFSTPIKLYEYMATNNIVIAANTNPIKEIINAHNGFLFESGNINELANTIQKVIHLGNEKLKDIALNAFEKSKEFSWENRAKKILNIIYITTKNVSENKANPSK